MLLNSGESEWSRAGKIEAEARGCEERSTVSSEGLGAMDVNTEANTSSPLDTACFVGSVLGKNQTIINTAFISRTKWLPGAPCSVGRTS